MEFPRRDLMAVNIQRARDHGAPDYNTARRSLGLEPIRNFASFIQQTATTVHLHDAGVLGRFERLYRESTINNVDLWAGGLLETSLGPGPLFKAILVDQFTRIRSADRFWYANLENKLFTVEEVRRLEQLRLSDVIMAVTRMDVGDLQENPFLSPTPEIVGQNLSPTCMNVMSFSSICTRFGPTNQGNERGNFTCTSLPQTGTTQAPIEACTPPSSFSYFRGSELSFPVTVGIECLIVVVVLAVLLILLIANHKKKEEDNKKLWKDQVNKRSIQNHPEWYTEFSGVEWMGHKDGTRFINLLFNSRDKIIEIRNENTQLVRSIDLSKGQPFDLWLCSNGYVASIKFPKEYDLVIKCEGKRQRDRFVSIWHKFVTKANVNEQQRSRNPIAQMTERNLLSNAVTLRIRRKRLQKFFRSVFAQALNYKVGEDHNDMNSAEVLLVELSKQEFANELRMTPDCPFVTKMFELVDKDRNGFISFHEFLDLLVIFSQGTVEEKLSLIFTIYDTQQKGSMSLIEFKTMIRSLVDLSNAKLDDAQLTATVQDMIASLNLKNPDMVSITEFQRLMSKHKTTLKGMQMAFTGPDVPVEMRSAGPSSRYNQARNTIMTIYGTVGQDIQSKIELEGESISRGDTNSVIVEQETSSVSTSLLEFWTKRLDYWRLEVCWLTLFTCFALGAFAERCYTYSVEREHVGFRQAVGWGVSITRGAASAMMVCFSFVLLSTCRHVSTWLRETPVNRYVPLDSVIAFHQYAAWLGVFFTCVHTIGHGFNFYYLATQPASDLSCLIREHYFPSHVLPKYHSWVYGTSTGITGVLLWIQTVVIFFFSLPTVRRNLFVAFWITHKSYPVFYTLLLLHGAARLIQAPQFPFYLIGPVVIFCINLLISLGRRRVQVSILDAKILPSGVTNLRIQRPTDFKYYSGQWMHISCPTLGDEVYHPFTISSAPQNKDLTVHIRAVGPWTKRLRETIQLAIHRGSPLPKVFIDGPYGEGHQEWRRYPVSILVGAGIGVTPFSSILQDIGNRLCTQSHSIFCKKIYFLWITRDQKQFEWMVDLIRQIEAKDTHHLISTNVFITQFQSKYDIRTVMLYVCERHFQKIEHRSLFTGLRSVTHFGHPNFHSIFKNVESIHSDVDKIGVFSCGPRSLVQSVDTACRGVNEDSSVDFRHHFEIY